MSHKVYVGNLPYTFTAQDLGQLFAEFGVVKSSEVIMDRMTGRSRGFGFVEFDSTATMLLAIAGRHGQDLQGRNLTVTEARDKAPGGPGGGGGGASFGGPLNPRPSRPFSGGGGGGGRAPGHGGGHSGGGGRLDRRGGATDRGDRRYSDGGARRGRDEFDDDR